MLHWLLALATLAAAEKQCLLDLYSSKQGGDVCVLDVDDLCMRPNYAILSYEDSEEETRQFAFDSNNGGYDALVDRMLEQGAVPDTTYLSMNTTLSCSFGDYTFNVFDDTSLDACFAFADINGDAVTSLSLGYKRQMGGKCLRFPGEEGAGAAAALAVKTALGSHWRSITFDQNANGYIADGGEDAFDNGFYMTTDVCDNHASGQRLYPWVPGWVPTVYPRECFGAGSMYQMEQSSGVLVFFAKNEADVPVDLWITGWKGNGVAASSHPAMEVYESGGVHGWSQCYPESGQASALQKMVITRTRNEVSVDAGFNQDCVGGRSGLPYGASSDCVNLFVEDIQPQYSVVVILWSETVANTCGENRHEDMFNAVVETLGC